MGEATFGKYRLIAELGHGGMADVFLAVMAGPAGSGFSKLTVIKRLRQNLAEEPEFIEMLVDEARISARLNHPNVVQTNEVGEVNNQYFLAMEYLDGQPLHRIQHRAMQKAQKAAAGDVSMPPPSDPTPAGSISVLPTDPFPRDCQYLVLVDTLAGLHHAHELADYDGSSLDIVHRDVTPHNVFVTYDGQVKVVDFGIAKAAGRASETRQGVVKGKVRYMAPEQAIGQPVDRRADVFSVGIMLWEAAVGQRLWSKMDDLHIVQALVTGNVKTSPREVDPTVPAELDRICRKALAANRDDRYATADEFRIELEAYLAESGQLVGARRKLGAVVSNLFKDKRAEIRAVIEKQLSLLKTEELSSEQSLPAIPIEAQSGPHPAVSSSSALSVNVRDEARAAPPITAPGLEANAPKKSRSFGGRIAAVTGVLAATVAGVAMMRGGWGAAEPKSTTTTLSTTTASGAASAPTVQVPSDVRVKLSATPSSAKITLDGTSVAAPYETRLPRDTHEHRVRIEAPGYEPHVETIRLDSDVTIAVTLQKTSSTPPAATAAAPAKPTPAAPSKPTPAQPESTARPAAASATPNVVATPPTTPSNGKPAVAKPEIDKGDPWGNH